MRLLSYLGLWYDGLWLEHEPKTNSAEIPAFWRGKELNDKVRRLQPHIVINNRLGDPADFDTPEGTARRKTGIVPGNAARQ